MNDPMSHLDYEVEMLIETYMKAAKEPERIAGNAFIESFCTHARLLFELFAKESKNPRYTQGFVPLHNPTDYSKILNHQISHLGALRTHDDRHKINHAVRTDMIDRIRDDLARFKTGMLDQEMAATIRDVPVMSISVSGNTPSATGAMDTTNTATMTTATITSGPVKITP